MISICLKNEDYIVMKEPRLRIKLRAYDHKLLDNSVNEIVNTAKETGARVAGPIPLPTEINKFTVILFFMSNCFIIFQKFQLKNNHFHYLTCFSDFFIYTILQLI